jgi:uncharacterized membrane protein
VSCLAQVWLSLSELGDGITTGKRDIRYWNTKEIGKRSPSVFHVVDQQPFGREFTDDPVDVIVEDPNGVVLFRKSSAEDPLQNQSIYDI